MKNSLTGEERQIDIDEKQLKELVYLWFDETDNPCYKMFLAPNAQSEAKSHQGK